MSILVFFLIIAVYIIALRIGWHLWFWRALLLLVFAFLVFYINRFNKRGHYLKISFWSNLEAWEGNVFERVMHYFNKSGRRNARKVLVIYKIGSYFTDTGLTREHSRSEGLASKLSLMASGVVRCKRFFVNRFENCHFLLLSISHFICATSSIICKLWNKSWIKTLPYLIDNFFHLLVTIHWTVNINIWYQLIDFRFQSKCNNYNTYYQKRILFTVFLRKKIVRIQSFLVFKLHVIKKESLSLSWISCCSLNFFL